MSKRADTDRDAGCDTKSDSAIAAQRDTPDPRAPGDARRAFVARLSHDMRTPLNAILGFTELLQDGHLDPSSPGYQDALASMETSGRRLLTLVDELLRWAEQNAATLEGEPPLSLCEVHPPAAQPDSARSR